LNPTSLAAYQDLVRSGAADRGKARILRLLLEVDPRPLTRNELARCFRAQGPDGLAFDGLPEIPLATVCGRCNELLHDDKVIRKVKTDVDPCSRAGNKADFLGVVR
jgi:hypothetical protein